jgi:exopolysaccharide biosynthesis polyprenyl glycosylphosphotransferase
MVPRWMARRPAVDGNDLLDAWGDSDPGDAGPAIASVAPSDVVVVSAEAGRDLSGVEVAPPEIVVDLRDSDGPTMAAFSPQTTTTIPRPARRGLAEAAVWQLAVKRGIDVFLSVLLLVLLAPIMAFTVLAIRLTSRGPVVLPQERIGVGGRPFTMFKFRSMYLNAQETREAYAALNERDGPVFKIRRDPRTTPVGRLIRQLSIDELPQLVNVLRGEMSLVGPRPPLPEEVAQYTAFQRQRLEARPGITCIWQVSGRSELDFDTWVEMDLEYIDNWSLWIDLRLLARTIPAVLSRRGAW